MKLLLLLMLIVLATLTCNAVYAQLGIADSGINMVSRFLVNLKPKALLAMDKQYAKTEARITKQSTNYLKKLEKKEENLKKKLAKTDSAKAEQVFGNVHQHYATLRGTLRNTNGRVQKVTHYIPGLDSMSTATKFLSHAAGEIPNYSPAQFQALQQLNGHLSSIGQKMQNATDIKEIVRQREADLKQQLQNSVISKGLDGLNKQVYYYQQQLSEYKDLLNNPGKLGQKVLGVIRETPVFKDFMSRYSMLALLFPTPAVDNATGQALAGLQTRSSVQQQLQQVLSSAGGGSMASPQSYLQQQVQAAQTQLTQLKEKINSMGGGSSNIAMPDFKPNSQKTKTLLARIQYGFNLQSQQSNYLLPATSDLALTAGYKLNDKSTVGLGAGYKLGWGKPFNEIALSSQGVSLRSYLDLKLKGSVWISGGYEKNYLQLFSKLPGWNDGAWQSSALIGLTKKYKVGKKTSNLQLLYDFLHQQHTPQTQSLIFRIGYQF